jgi:two-component system, LuxR family, response regulator FixJ
VSDASAIVYIIDDDEIILMMFQEFLQGIGATFRTHSSARAFLDAYRPSPCECLVCDVRMPEIGGLQVQRELLEKGSELPIIFVSGYAEVPAAVEAMRRGAFDFLEKPVSGSVLVEKVQEALARSRSVHTERLRRAAREARLALLTPKERQIAELVVSGKSSPTIARELQISVRTVENHRARVMEKLHVTSAVDLVKLFL